jgi:hypothetical protein
MKPLKKLGALLTSLALANVAYAVQDPNWVQVGKAVDGTRYYLDVNNVSEGSKDSFTVWFWAKKSNEPQSKYSYVVARMRGDCALTSTVWSEGQAAYNKLGQLVASDRQAREMTVTVGTGNAKLLAQACEVIHERHMK